MRRLRIDTTFSLIRIDNIFVQLIVTSDGKVNPCMLPSPWKLRRAVVGWNVKEKL